MQVTRCTLECMSVDKVLQLVWSGVGKIETTKKKQAANRAKPKKRASKKKRPIDLDGAAENRSKNRQEK